VESINFPESLMYPVCICIILFLDWVCTASFFNKYMHLHTSFIILIKLLSEVCCALFWSSKRRKIFSVFFLCIDFTDNKGFAQKHQLSLQFYILFISSHRRVPTLVKKLVMKCWIISYLTCSLHTWATGLVQTQLCNNW